MLDVALLTANASQLRYVLQVGEQHEFYTLMVTLICLSIILQVRQHPPVVAEYGPTGAGAVRR